MARQVGTASFSRFRSRAVTRLEAPRAGSSTCAVSASRAVGQKRGGPSLRASPSSRCPGFRAGGTSGSSVTRYGQVTDAVGTDNGSPWPTMNVAVNLA